MYNIVLREMPTKIKACMVKNSDGTFTIVLNSCLDNIQLLEGCLHELRHIENNDYQFDIVDAIEEAAHRQRKDDIP